MPHTHKEIPAWRLHKGKATRGNTTQPDKDYARAHLGKPSELMYAPYHFAEYFFGVGCLEVYFYKSFCYITQKRENLF